MPKRIVSTLIFITLISCTSAVVSANTLTKPILSRLISGIVVDDNFVLSGFNAISTKKGERYDESKDPALRRGTENWEEPQGSYFAIPALIVGVIGLVLFFNRDK